MATMDKPTIAAINGTARGAGMDMALMCDLRVMSDTASLAETYIDVGLIAGDGGSWYLPRLIGCPRALELLWTGRVVESIEAARIGLVNHVVPHEELMMRATSLASSIAAQSAEAVRMYKRAVCQGLSMPLDAHLDMVSSHISILRDTDLAPCLPSPGEEDAKGPPAPSGHETTQQKSCTELAYTT